MPLHWRHMLKTVEAVYEGGVLRPLEPLGLKDQQHVQVTIDEPEHSPWDIAAYFDSEEWESSKTDPISLEEVRQALSGIRGSLADAVIESREERF